MWSRLTTPNIAYSVLTQLKDHLRYSGTSEDAIIVDYFQAAVARVENTTGIQIGLASFAAVFDGFPARGQRLCLMPSPLVSVSAVSYRDTSGATVEWSAANYLVNIVRGTIEPVFDGAWPTDVDRNVSVTYSAGWAEWASVPIQARHAVFMLTEHYFDQRAPVIVGTSASPIPETIETLLTQLHYGDEFSVYA